MEAAKWATKIKKQCKSMGTYQSAFDPAIDGLAKILSQRDAAIQKFNDEGSELMFEHVSDRGAVNKAVNPLVKLIDTLNNTALAYWKELGLTPASYKKMVGSTAPVEKKGGLAEALKAIESD